MVDIKVRKGEAGETDFNHHARDYSLMIKLLKYGAIVSLIVTFLVLLIIAN